MLIKKSPLAPSSFPNLPKVGGISMSSINCGIRKNKKPDLILVTMQEGTSAACTLTRSKMPSAPVNWCKKIRGYGRARALVVNSGNANAHTGEYGELTVKNTVNKIVDLIKCNKNEVYVASTGVIGEKIEIRPMMYLALSYDHRIIDGNQSVGFLIAVKEGVEDPINVLMDGNIEKSLAI